MPNTSYLVRTLTRVLDPSRCEPNFNAETWTVAAGIRCVPLMWISMFRPTDLVTQEITIEGNEIFNARSVVTATSTALAQLKEAIPFLDEIFDDSEKLGPYAKLLAGAIAAVDLPFITIELDEVASVSFLEGFELALRGLKNRDSSVSYSGPDEEGINPFTKEKIIFRGPRAENLAELLRLLSGLDPLDDEDAYEVRRSRLLGCRHFAPVPWEP